MSCSGLIPARCSSRSMPSLQCPPPPVSHATELERDRLRVELLRGGERPSSVGAERDHDVVPVVIAVVEVETLGASRVGRRVGRSDLDLAVRRQEL